MGKGALIGGLAGLGIGCSWEQLAAHGSNMHQPSFGAFSVLLLAACEAAANSGDYVDVRVVNSTDLSNVLLTIMGDRGTTVIWTFSTPNDPAATTGTGIQTAGERVRFRVEAGKATTEHGCHVHSDAIGDPSNIPTAVIYGEPLRVVCLSGCRRPASV